jgi:hypothetical protein
VLRRADPDDCD